MADGILGGIGRDIIEMIDERLSGRDGTPMKFGRWTVGSWVLLVIVVGTVSYFGSLIWHYAIVPLWQFALWLSAGKGLDALNRIQVSMIFKTTLFFGMMIFIIFGGFGAVRTITWAFWSMWRDKRSLVQQIRDELATEPRWRRITFWPSLVFSVAFILLLYIFCGFWVVQQFGHDMGIATQLRAAMSRCLQAGLPPPPVQLNMPAGK
jgi:hypothetical protein